MFNKLALYCRAGFEKEVAGEITEKLHNRAFLALPTLKKIVAM